MKKYLNACWKIMVWLYSHPKTARFLSYLLFPIIFPLVIVSNYMMRWLFKKGIIKSLQNKDDHRILKLNGEYLKFIVEKNKWKNTISKKWFNNSIEKKLYRNYCWSYPNKEVKYGMFKTLMDVYWKYDIISGAVI